ncbi:MAG: glycoside hydrolase family 3 protein [Deltaproteobacteria bacterium]|nr:glycoside hydrolase family 3 protein [Deltaproteobacteria bacterium]
MRLTPKVTLACSLFGVLLVAGCTEKETIKTETEVKIVTLDCSAEAPTGKCDTGSTCVEGVCQLTDTICSPTNLTGSCPTGKLCFSGGCVVESGLCSATELEGPCELGNACFEGVCTPRGELCSTTNTTGKCPTGQTCVEGLCAGNIADPCEPIYTAQPVIGVDTKTKITVDGLEFKDLDGDGALTPYEDWRLPEICRARDLVARMTVPQMVGLMSEGGTIGSGTADGTLSETTITRITDGHVRQALIRLGQRSGAELAVYLNNVQKLSEQQPLGIPFVVTTDPSHGFGMSTNAVTGAQTLSASGVVSPWPYPMGLGAINDEAVTRLYGDTVRREFMGMGFRWQLGPMADLATEPRWARVQNTFGENAFHVAKHTKACIQGFQGYEKGGLKNGIAATMKHFPGAGADEDGMDSHSRPGKYNVYPGNNFEYHQIPFMAAIEAGAASVMPCYSIFKGQTEFDPEQVGSAYSDGLITRYLKETLGFDGMVTSDWGVIGGTSWGMESMTQPERAAKFIKAGSHQFGNDSNIYIQQAYDQGLLTQDEIAGAAAKILEMTFRLGLFENPYVDGAATEVRSVENRTNGFIAQKKAVVILKNGEHSSTSRNAPKYLPISGTSYTDANGNSAPDIGEYNCDINGDGTVEVYFDGVTDGLVGGDYMDDILEGYDYTTVGGANELPIMAVATPAEADIAVLRITARKGTYFGLDAGVPLSFDAPFPGLSNDGGLASAMKDAAKVIDLLRIRDGYTDASGNPVAASNPNLKIVLVMHMDRPGIVKPFISGLNTLDENLGESGSYPMVSVTSNIRADGLGGVDGFMVEFGALDRAVLDVLFNVNVPTEPEGYAYGQSRLPVEIPASDADVDFQYEDLPADTLNPTFALGAGMTY